MKNKDKICEAFDNLNKELDAKLTPNEGVNSDQDSINIDKIENNIMDKLEKMIDSKLNTLNATNEDEPIIDVVQDNENKGDETDES